MKYIDLTGKKFGLLTVLSRSTNTKTGNAQWNCICDCGQKTIVYSRHLRIGNTKSCGCLSCIKPYTDKSLSCKHQLFLKYKNSAKKRGYSFELTFKDFINITKQSCYYCGEPPKQEVKHPDAREFYIYNGLDRINNKKGYIIDNIVPCCKNCNYLKWNRDQKDFILWIKNCYNNLSL